MKVVQTEATVESAVMVVLIKIIVINNNDNKKAELSQR